MSCFTWHRLILGRFFYARFGHHMNFIIWLLILSCLSSSCSSSSASSDVQCLKELKQSLGDPNGALSSWDFSNNNATEGYDDICQFTGVSCWPGDENSVMFLALRNLGLQGSFPQGLQLCTGITSLDLSNNHLSGPLPADVSMHMPYVTNLTLSHNGFSGEIPEDISRRLPFIKFLDLSNNSFSGEIPRTISKLPFLTILNLQHNQLTGSIPEQIGDLALLKSLDLSGNELSGPIPASLQRLAAEDFAGNDGLCGVPLDRRCKKRFRLRRLRLRIRLRLRRVNDASSIGAAVGFVVGFVVAFYFPHWFLFCGGLRPYHTSVCATDTSDVI